MASAPKNRRTPVFYVFFFVSLFGLPLLVGEIYSRKYLINSTSFLVVDKKASPSLQLRSSRPWSEKSAIRIKPTSFELGHRPKKIGVIGDSVTFCVSVSEENCFSTVMQKKQETFDIYNFGVPGYGIPEIKQALKDITAAEQFDSIVYVYNMNDVYDAMPVLLTLARDPMVRFASIYDYRDGLLPRIKKIGIDYFKLPFVLQYLVGSFTWTTPSEDSKVATLSEKAVSENDCFLSQKNALLDSWTYRTAFQTVQKMYRDPKLPSKISTAIGEMKNLVEAKGTKFVVVPFFDFALYADSKSEVKDQILSVLRTSSAAFVDSDPFFRAHFRECGIYQSDLSHFDEKGSRLFGEWLTKKIAGADRWGIIRQSSLKNPGEFDATRAAHRALFPME